MTTYTYTDLLPVMARVVMDEGAEFRYQPKKSFVEYGTGEVVGCHYKWMGEPDCAIGRLLHKLGISLNHMGDGADIDDGGIDEYYDYLGQDHNMYFTPDAQTFMESFQQNQDESVPWGDCLDMAVEDAERILNIED